MLFRENIRGYVLVLLLLVTVFVWSVTLRDSEGLLLVAFLDVGQGDAIFIETPNGSQVLIDGGSNRMVLSALGEVMPFYDRSIDVIIATHPDLDHIGGLPAVFQNFSVSLFLEPGVASESAAYRALLLSIEESGAERVLARRGMRVTLDEETFLDILFPDRDPTTMNTNDASIILRLVHGENSFLFTGDSPKKIERYLTLLDGSGLKSDVLKVGHHGSKTSSGERFIGFVSPEISVVSVGKDNRYGHPHEEVLDILRGFGSKIFRTDMLETIIIKSDGEVLYY